MRQKKGSFPLIPSLNLAQFAAELVGNLNDRKLSKGENIHIVGTLMTGGEETSLSRARLLSSAAKD